MASTILSVIGANAITPLPSSAQQAFSLASDPKAEARDFIVVIEGDEGLSGRILRVANSVYFDRGKKTETIEEAVLLIGVAELRCLLGATSLSNLLPSKHPARGHLWGHDIAVAILAKNIASSVLPRSQDAAFIAGLMHDIGKLLLLQRAEEKYLEVLKKVESEGLTFTAVEQDAFLFNHCEVGLLIAEKWNFTEELTSAIGHHHEAPSYPFTVASVVHCADTVAHALGLGLPPSFNKLRTHFEEQLPKVFKYLGVSTSSQQNKIAQWKHAYEFEFELYINKQSTS